jgi:hypothetical protein
VFDRIFLEWVQAQAPLVACRSDRAVVLGLALRNAANGGADLTHGTVRFGEAHAPSRGWNGVAILAFADEAAPIAGRTVGDTDISRVVPAAGDPEEHDEKRPEACHVGFDALHGALFTCVETLKTEQFR